MKDMSWQLRLAVVISIIWLGLVGALVGDERNPFASFFLVGALPIAFLWGITWAWIGFRNQRQPAAATQTDSSKVESPTTATLFQSLAFVFTAFGIGIFYYAFSNTSLNPAERIGYFIGFYFWVPLLTYWLWKGTFKKKKGVGVLLFATAFLGIALYQSHAMLREEQEGRQTISVLQSMMVQLMDGKLIDKSEFSKAGRYSPFLFVTHDFISQIMGNFQGLNAKLNAASLETMLTPATLQDPRKIESALIELHDLKVSIDRTNSAIALSYDNLPNEIDAIASTDLSYNDKMEFKNSAEHGLKNGKASFASFFDIETTFISTATAMLQFMKSRQGHFRQNGNQLIFTNQPDLNTYNQYLRELQAIALKESDWRNSQLQASTKQILNMQ